MSDSVMSSQFTRKFFIPQGIRWIDNILDYKMQQVHHSAVADLLLLYLETTETIRNVNILIKQ